MRQVYPKRTIKKIKTMCKIAHALHEPATFIVLHDRLKMPKATLSERLNDMVNLGLLKKEVNLYRLSLPQLKYRRAFLYWLYRNLPLRYEGKVGRPKLGKKEVEAKSFHERIDSLIGEFVKRLPSDKARRKEMIEQFWKQLDEILDLYASVFY